MMKVEWRVGRKNYHSCVLEEQAAWLLKAALEDQGYAVGIESMSKWECEEYFKTQLEAAQ